MTTLQEALIAAALDASSRGLISGTTNWAAFVAECIKAALAQQGEQRCTYCDGTGDVHSIDGEWRGSCPCAAAPAPQAQGEPVYQYQMADGSWIDQIKDSYDYNRKYAPNATVRVVYTATPAPQPVHRGERAELIRRLYAIANTEANEVADALNEAADMLQSAQPAQEPVKFLVNGTRFKLSFDTRGRVSSLWTFMDELDGRWVSLVAAEDDCHLQSTQPKQEPLTDDQIIDLENEVARRVGSRRALTIGFARAIEAAHGINGMVEAATRPAIDAAIKQGGQHE